MFNKSILAAALLTVGAIAGGTAASAAEIGVRHTYGSTHRNITAGHSWSVRGGYETYSEESAGFGLGIIADEFTSEGLDLAPVEVNAYRGSVFGPAGSIINRDEVLEDDRDIFTDVIGTSVGGNADAEASRSGDVSINGSIESPGTGRSGNAASDAAPGGDAAPVTVYGGTQRIVGDNTVVQVAEASEAGWGEGLTITGGLAGTPTAVDGRLAVSGSGYVRSAQGASAFAAGEYYDFTGSSSSGFSELSTFSR